MLTLKNTVYIIFIFPRCLYLYLLIERQYAIHDTYHETYVSQLMRIYKVMNGSQSIDVYRCCFDVNLLLL